MKTLTLSLHEQAVHRANRLTVITHADLTEATDNTAQAIVIASIAAGLAFGLVKVELPTAFQQAGVSGYNSNTVKIGDAGDDDRFLAAVQLNVNGTEVNHAFNLTAPAATFSEPTAATGGDSPTEAEHNAVITALSALAADVAAIRLRLAAGHHLYASATDVLATFASMASYSLADLDGGEIHIYWNLYQLVNP